MTAPRAFGSGYLFGIPLGDLGLFATLLMSTAVGFAAFFAATFCAIITLLFYKIATGHMPDFTITYKWVGLPVGVVDPGADAGLSGHAMGQAQAAQGLEPRTEQPPRRSAQP